MEAWLTSAVHGLLVWLAVPSFGLGALFIVSLLSATLLPLGSEPALYGLVQLQPGLIWPALAVATFGNTLGGAVSWWMGRGAERAVVAARHRPVEHRALGWLQRFGPPACLLSWLPLVGDPLCALAGWLRMPFWPCVAYMAIGKFVRYLAMLGTLRWLFPGLA